MEHMKCGTPECCMQCPLQLELFPSTLSPKEYRRYWDNFYPTSEGEPVYEELG